MMRLPDGARGQNDCKVPYYGDTMIRYCQIVCRQRLDQFAISTVYSTQRMNASFRAGRNEVALSW